MSQGPDVQPHTLQASKLIFIPDPRTHLSPGFRNLLVLPPEEMPGTGSSWDSIRPSDFFGPCSRIFQPVNKTLWGKGEGKIEMSSEKCTVLGA